MEKYTDFKNNQILKFQLEKIKQLEELKQSIINKKHQYKQNEYNLYHNEYLKYKDNVKQLKINHKIKKLRQEPITEQDKTELYELIHERNLYKNKMNNMKQFKTT